jgi:hypothetical protein
MTLSPLMKILLALTLAACAYVFWQSDDDTQNTAPPPVRRNNAPAMSGKNARQTDAEDAPAASATAAVDLFPRQNWAPPPPPVPAKSANEPKPLPVVTLQAIGEWQYEGGRPVVVLADQQAGEFYFLCAGCDMEGKILPHQNFGEHFRFEGMDRTTVHLTDLRNRHTVSLARNVVVLPSANQ